MLSHCNIKTTHPSNKFDYCKLGPFKIISTIGSNAYHLQHPAALLQLHPVFNINLLEPYVQSGLPDYLQSTTAIPDMILEGENTLNIKQILDICKTGHCLDYLLDYVNKLISDCSWVPLSDIPSSYDELLECFHHCHPSLLKPSSHALKSKSHTTTPISHDPLANVLVLLLLWLQIVLCIICHCLPQLDLTRSLSHVTLITSLTS